MKLIGGNKMGELEEPEEATEVKDPIYFLLSYHSQETKPHLPGPDPVAAASEAMDDDLEREGRVEVGLLETGQVVVLEHLRNLPVRLRVEEQLGTDLLGRGGEHVQVVEGALVTEAAQVAVADNFLVTALAGVTGAGTG